MPPKPEKKKLSKAEKEKLKAEEEARKAEEEEEARRLAVEEEKLKKERERVEAAERKKLENEEKKNRNAEMSELDEIIQANKNSLLSLHDERRKKAKWARYMRCDGSPDPTVPGEINTYINLKLEDKQHNDVDSVLKKSELDLTLLNELDYLLEDTPPEEQTPADIERYKSTSEDLQDLIKIKLDSATQKLLEEATDRADNETFNLQYCIQNSEICLCVWGNLSKNPRIKQYEFAERGYNFDIPKTLSLSDCAIRVLFTKYDHYSPKCNSFYPRRKKIVEPEPEPEEEKVEEKEEDDDDLEKEDTTDVMAALRELEQSDNEDEEKEEEKKEEEKEEEFDEYIDPTSPEPPDWEDFEGDEEVVDLRAYHVLGGAFHFDLMNLPPQPKTAKSWVITIKDPPEIQYMEYVADSATASPAQNNQKDAQEEKKRDEKPPIVVNMRMPEDVMLQEEPQIARWNEKKSFWSLDGFSDFKYDEDTRMFSFKTSHFGTMVLLQDAHINMPFQSWEIRPHSANSAVFTIIAAINEIEIEIKDAMCCLSKPDDKPELAHIKDKWVTPRELVKLLRKAGVNLFPAEDSSKYVSVQNKNPIVEDRAYLWMAMTVSAMAYSWSKWNGERDDRQSILFQGAEALADEPLLEEDWCLFLMGKTRSQKLKMTEFDETFSEDWAEGTQFRSNLYHLLMSFSSEEAKERIRTSSFEFIDCVHQLLSATKVLTYA